jgi:hypothetical protein
MMLTSDDLSELKRSGFVCFRMKRATAMSAVLQLVLAFACGNSRARNTLVEAKHTHPQRRVFDQAS